MKKITVKLKGGPERLSGNSATKSAKSERWERRTPGFAPTLLLLLLSLLAGTASLATGQVSQPEPARDLQSAQSLVAKQAALVSEFEVNGLKVLVKRREGSLTVAAGLFIKGGSRNITADNAGIEALMLDAATEASAAFPAWPDARRTVPDGNSDFFQRQLRLFGAGAALHPAKLRPLVADVYRCCPSSVLRKGRRGPRAGAPGRFLTR